MGWLKITSMDSRRNIFKLCGRRKWIVSLMYYCNSKLPSIVPTSIHKEFTTIMHDRNPYDLRATYTRFRILVIGRANAGKTTLLQRVCNTTEDPCIYNEDNKNLVSLHTRRWILPPTFSTSLNLPQRYSTFYRYLLPCLILLSSEGYMTSVGRSHSAATLDLSSTILPDLRQATRSNCRKSCHFWRREQSRLK